MNLRTHRGIASSPLMRLAAERRPVGGFVEQRTAMTCMGINLQVCEALDELSGGVSAKIIAEILHGMSELDSAIAMNNSFLGMLHPSLLGVYGKVWKSEQTLKINCSN